MKKRYYNAETLKAELASYEQRFGLSTEELLALYRAQRVPHHIPAFDAFVWADTHREIQRLSGRRNGHNGAANRRRRTALQPAS